MGSIPIRRTKFLDYSMPNTINIFTSDDDYTDCVCGERCPADWDFCICGRSLAAYYINGQWRDANDVHEMDAEAADAQVADEQKETHE